MSENRVRTLGFTLAEVMTACGLLLIILLVSFKIFIPLIKYWTLAEEKSSVYSSVLTSVKRIQMELRNSSPNRVFIKKGGGSSDVLYLHSPLGRDSNFYTDIDLPEKFENGLGNIVWQSETAFYIQKGLRIFKKYDRDLQSLEYMPSKAVYEVLDRYIFTENSQLLLSDKITSIVFDYTVLKTEDNVLLKPIKKNVVFRINFEYRGNNGIKIKNYIDSCGEVMN